MVCRALHVANSAVQEHCALKLLNPLPYISEDRKSRSKRRRSRPSVASRRSAESRPDLGDGGVGGVGGGGGGNAGTEEARGPSISGEGKEGTTGEQSSNTRDGEEEKKSDALPRPPQEPTDSDEEEEDLLDIRDKAKRYEMVCGCAVVKGKDRIVMEHDRRESRTTLWQSELSSLIFSISSMDWRSLSWSFGIKAEGVFASHAQL